MQLNNKSKHTLIYVLSKKEYKYVLLYHQLQGYLKTCNLGKLSLSLASMNLSP